MHVNHGDLFLGCSILQSAIVPEMSACAFRRIRS